MANNFHNERQITRTAKRERIREDQYKVIDVANAKRKLATAQRDEAETKRKVLAGAALAAKAKKEEELAAAAARRHRVWLQTQFAAHHVAATSAHKKALGSEAISHIHATIKDLQSRIYFSERWISIADPWQDPDLKLWIIFGSLPNVSAKFGNAAGRKVRCSPELEAFILGKTDYRHTLFGPDPEAALRHLLRTCFTLADFMFQGACSPFQLLCRCQLILDMAFVRAVLIASQWLGFLGMPAGYIDKWPPEQPVAAV